MDAYYKERNAHMKQIRTVALNLLSLAVSGFTLYLAWKFATLDLPHPVDFICQYVDSLKSLGLGHKPDLNQDGIITLFTMPIWYLTGITLYLGAGVIVAQSLQFVARCSAVGFDAAWEEQRHAEAVWARWHRIDAIREKREEEGRDTQSAASISIGAIAFGVFLGWLLFHD